MMRFASFPWLKEKLVPFTIFGLALVFQTGLVAAAEPESPAANAPSATSADVPRVKFSVGQSTAVEHKTNDFQWFHPRAVAIPHKPGDQNPTVLMTVIRHLGASDHYSGTYVLQTEDLGKTWSEPVMPPELDWVKDSEDVDIAVADVTPVWHPRTGKVIAIGAQVRYSAAGKQLEDVQRAHQTAYAVYDPAKKTWTRWQRLEMPDERRFDFARSACAQVVVEPDGSLLLPFYISESAKTLFRTLVGRCAFDGKKLTFVEAGNELSLNIRRGIYEPSIVAHAGKYYLTMRNDQRAYVSSSTNGLHYKPIKPWTFEDGKELGSYNTQQHWLSHSDGLFLSYTRRGAKNDHVFRHRAPLFIAQVDPERLVVLRDTEKILLPERGAAFGNFGVTPVNENETWVTDAEAVLHAKRKDLGAEGGVFVAQVKWEQPNKSSLAPYTHSLLQSGKKAKIVCFGDSVTGVYYHTGSRRAYADMLQLALRKQYGHDNIEVINAGISGNTTRNALDRIMEDVLTHKPDLVTIMFGLNDMTRISEADYQKNLIEIMNECRGVGTEVLLCTPNNVINTSGRPITKLERYCELIKIVGRGGNESVLDIYGALEQDRIADPLAWRKLMSDPIHPNMAGHKRMAELMAEAVSNRKISLTDVPPSQPRIKELLAKAKEGKTVKVLATAPADSVLRDWLKQQVPDGNFEVTTWQGTPESLADWVESAKQQVRPMKPDLVVLELPRPAKAISADAIINAYSWIMNYSLNFGPPSWDCLIIHPIVFQPKQADSSTDTADVDRLIRELVAAQDLTLLDRVPKDERTGEEKLEAWLTESLEER